MLGSGVNGKEYNNQGLGTQSSVPVFGNRAAGLYDNSVFHWLSCKCTVCKLRDTVTTTHL